MEPLRCYRPLGFWRSLTPPQKEAFRFHHISTDEVFGSLGAEGFFAETSRYSPNSPYAASKAAADHLVSAWRHTHGLPTIISNCSNNFGPNHFPEKLIPLTIINALEGRDLPVYGTGANVRDWLYVEDHARALLDRRDARGDGTTPSASAASARRPTLRSCWKSARCSTSWRLPTTGSRTRASYPLSRTDPAMICVTRSIPDKITRELAGLRSRHSQQGCAGRSNGISRIAGGGSASGPAYTAARGSSDGLILVLGAGGQIGRELQRQAALQKIALTAHPRDRVDICDPPPSRAPFAQPRPPWSSTPPPTPRSTAPKARASSRIIAMRLVLASSLRFARIRGRRSSISRRTMSLTAKSDAYLERIPSLPFAFTAKARLRERRPCVRP